MHRDRGEMPHEPLYVNRLSTQLPILMVHSWIEQGYADWEESRDTRFMRLVHALQECALQQYDDAVINQMIDRKIREEE